MIDENSIIIQKLMESDSKETFYFLLAGHKVDFIAPSEANNSTLCN